MAGRTYGADAGRVRLTFLGMLGALALLGGRLWWVQVARGERYEQDLRRQSMRRVRLPGYRGRILDRGGACLAENRPAYGVSLYLEELREAGRWSNTVDRVEALLDEMAMRLGIERQRDRRAVETHIRRRLPLAFPAWDDIGEKVAAKFAERQTDMRGVDLVVHPRRRYPLGAVAAHVIGYVGRAEIGEEEADDYHYLLPDMEGRRGVEKRWDEVLRGRAGGRLLRVDASGCKRGVVSEVEPEAGADVVLALDLGIQRLAERVLEGVRGAVAILDPRNGDVLAAASNPRFDLRLFAPSISVQDWERLRDDPANPLLHRAAAGQYAPGSLFKVVVAAAALENGRADAGTEFLCPGFFELGAARYACWKRAGHGVLAMREALEQSCNVYFFRLGLQTGYEAIYHMAAAMGLGRPTGVALEYEASGLLPDDAWKRDRVGDSWRAGDTCNASIGQGFILATPMQLAVVAAAVANGGAVWTPRLVLRTCGPEGTERVYAPDLTVSLSWSRETLETVRGGMTDVVQVPSGTGRRAYTERMPAAGKTGTAEYGRKSEGRKHGWMMAYAPSSEPRYALAMVVEDADSGGITVAPRVRALLEGLAALEAGGGQG